MFSLRLQGSLPHVLQKGFPQISRLRVHFDALRIYHVFVGLFVVPGHGSGNGFGLTQDLLQLSGKGRHHDSGGLRFIVFVGSSSLALLRLLIVLTVL